MDFVIPHQGTTMKLQRLTPLLAALVLAVPAISMAQDHHDRDRPDWDHPGYRHDYYRGAGPNHDWQRGARLPSEYRGRQYEVADWHAAHLSAPPRGYHWVRAGDDYVLAAIATGVILDTLLSQ
jgi:Ni/Co efflux regulator RcnB